MIQVFALYVTISHQQSSHKTYLLIDQDHTIETNLTRVPLLVGNNFNITHYWAMISAASVTDELKMIEKLHVMTALKMHIDLAE